MQTLNERAMLARHEEQEFAGLLKEYSPFILSLVTRFCSKADEEYVEAAMLAFAEAINSYDESKGNFLSLARMVIERRLVDTLRKVSKYRDRETLFGGDAGLDDRLLQGAAKRTHQLKEEERERREEIRAFEQALSAHQLRFSDLPAAAPKQEKTRAVCADALRQILSNAAMKQKVLQNRVPVKELALSLGIHPKLLERHRKYIVAATIAHSGDFPYIKAYVRLHVERSAQ